MKIKVINGVLCNDYGDPIFLGLRFECLQPQGDHYTVRCLIGDRWIPGTVQNVDGVVAFCSIEQDVYRSGVAWTE